MNLSSNAVPRTCQAIDDAATGTTVVHVIGTLNRGGAETVALDLCKAIPVDQVSQIFLTLGPSEGRLASQFRAEGAAVHRCPLVPLGTFPFRLWRQLKRFQPHAVVSHVSLSSGFILLIARASGAKIRIARIHSESDGRPDTRLRRLQRVMLRRLIRHCATDIVGVTENAVGFSAGGKADLRYRVLYNGVNTERLRTIDRSSARRLQALPANAPIFLHLGRAATEKNRGFLIPVYREAILRNPNVELLIVGPGGQGDFADTYPGIRGESGIRMLGELDDVAPVLAAADVMLLPSVREGLPGAVLESLACGVPVIANDLPGLREIAGQVHGLTLVPLAEGPSRWADAALAMARLSPTERHDIRLSMGTSPFNFDSTRQAWISLWTQHLHTEGSP